MPFVDSRIPPVPVDATVNIAQPLRSLQPIASAALHLMAWRFRRLITAQWTWDPSIGYGYSVDPAGETQDRRVRWHTSPLARYLHVTIVYQAAEGGTAPTIALNLYDIATSTLQDGPVTFDRSEGTLPGAQVETGEGAGLASLIDEYPFLVVHTGTDTRPAGDDRVGLLNVPTAARDEDVELVLTPAGARIRAVTVWEYPTVEI